MARIQGVHPELTSDEALRGIVRVRAANMGTLTGMSMAEIIAKVRDSVIETAATSSVDSIVLPIGTECEQMVNAPLEEKIARPEPAPSSSALPKKKQQLHVPPKQKKQP